MLHIPDDCPSQRHCEPFGIIFQLCGGLPAQDLHPWPTLMKRHFVACPDAVHPDTLEEFLTDEVGSSK